MDIAIVGCYLILIDAAQDVVAVESTPDPGKAEGLLDHDLVV